VEHGEFRFALVFFRQLFQTPFHVQGLPELGVVKQNNGRPDFHI